MKQYYKTETELQSNREMCQISPTESTVQGCQKVCGSQWLPADFKGFGSNSGLHSKLLCFCLTFLLLNHNYCIKFSHYQIFSQLFFPYYLLLINFCQCLENSSSFIFIEMYTYQSLSLENSVFYFFSYFQACC